MATLYGTTAVARLLNMNPARLKRWCDYGHYEPDFKAVLGNKEYRLFSERDVEILAQILGKVNDGTPLRQIFNGGANYENN